MTVTREEWLAARARVYAASRGGAVKELDELIQAALGPCPPEPAPQRKMEVDNLEGVTRELVVEAAMHGRRRRVGIGIGHSSLFMSPDAADQLARWLSHCAKWIREYPERAA